MAARDEIDGLGPKTERPRVNTAIDLAQQKLSPTEGFVLSRVDGRISYDEICMVSGLGREETLRILRDLKQTRLILGPGEVAVGSSRKHTGHMPAVEVTAGAAASAPAQGAGTETPRSRAAGSTAAGAASADQPGMPASEPALSRTADRRTPIGPLERLDDGSEVAAADVADWPDASLELKSRIVRLHRQLRHLSPWELLGVEKDADAATVRRAFGVASKELHPDRYFGRNLGSFKAKLAAIFARLSEAAQEIERSRKGRSGS
jgi:hypothetical protein